MKKIILVISAIIATAVSAQESHIILQKSNGTNFIPAELRDGHDTSLHIYNGKNILNINPAGNAGAYIVTQTENGMVTDCKKFIIR